MNIRICFYCLLKFIMNARCKIVSILLLFIFLGLQNSQAQDEAVVNKLFDTKNYDAALKGLTKLYAKDTGNIILKYKIGVCLLNARADKSKAIPYFENILKNPKNKNICWFELGKACQFANRFDDAINAYNKAKEFGPKKDREQVFRSIATCENAKILIQTPVNVTFYNIGKKVNTEYADYYPIVTPRDELLFFTSRRKGNTGNTSDGDGLITSDIYISENKDGVFQKPKNLGLKLNTIGDEQVTGVSEDGKKLVVYYDYGGKQFGDFLLSTNPKKEFETGVPISGGVNSPYFETAGCFGKTTSQMYFASDRPGGKGGRDLYLSQELPDGTWSDARPIDQLNTEFNEDFPQLSADGNTMYFASEGYNSMGGFDIFKSEYDSIANIWKTPVNMGYPINTTYDEFCFSSVLNQEYGYMSKVSEEGAGDYDIYKVYFNDRSQGQLSIINGLIIAGDSLRPNVKATVYVTNKQTNDTVGIYNCKRNGKFVVILPINEYKISIECNGFESYASDLTLYGGEKYRKTDSKTYRLMKLPASNSTINTFPEKTILPEKTAESEKTEAKHIQPNADKKKTVRKK